MYDREERQNRSFVCYRCANESDTEKTASQAMAHYLNSLESYASALDLKDFFPLMYEDDLKNRVDYLKDIPHLLSSVKHFILCISVGFFDDMLTQFAQYNDREKFYQVAKDFQTKNITYLEIREALNQGCEIYPVFIETQSAGKTVPAYLTEKTAQLKALFGEEFCNLFTITNIPTAFYQNVFSKAEPSAYDYTPNTPCPWGDMFLRNAIDYFQNGARRFRQAQNVKKLLFERLAEYYDQLISEGANYPIKRLEFKRNERDFSAYKRILESGIDGWYHISNAYIGGVKALEKADDETYDKFCGKGFEEVSALCNLAQSEDFVYWPIEFYEKNKKEKSIDHISICALCFGTLLLNSYLKTDEKIILDVLSDAPQIDKEDAQRKRDSAVNLLITLRDYEDYSWMSEWEFSDLIPCGTVNQTTLSLSTLLSTGFLNVWDGIDEKILANRFLYVQGSVQWLKEQCFDRRRPFVFCQGIEGEEETGNLTLTIFCADVFLKFLQTINSMVKNNLCGKLNAVFAEEKQSLIEKLQGIYAFLNKNIPTEFTTPESVCRLAKILRFYCDFIAEPAVFAEIAEDNTQMAQTIKTNALRMYQTLSNLSDDTILQCLYQEKLPVIVRNVDTQDSVKTDNYENCGNLICIDALIKSSILFPLDGSMEHYTAKRNLEARVSKLLTEYHQKNCTIYGVKYATAGDKGHYPMYALYYYRMAVTDFYKYF